MLKYITQGRDPEKIDRKTDNSTFIHRFLIPPSELLFAETSTWNIKRNLVSTQFPITWPAGRPMVVKLTRQIGSDAIIQEDFRCTRQNAELLLTDDSRNADSFGHCWSFRWRTLLVRWKTVRWHGCAHHLRWKGEYYIDIGTTRTSLGGSPGVCLHFWSVYVERQFCRVCSSDAKVRSVGFAVENSSASVIARSAFRGNEAAFIATR